MTHPSSRDPVSTPHVSSSAVEGVPMRQLLWFHLFGEAQRRQSLNIWTTFPKELLAVQKAFQHRLAPTSIDLGTFWIPQQRLSGSPNSKGLGSSHQSLEFKPGAAGIGARSKFGRGVDSIMQWRLRRWIQRSLEHRRVHVLQSASEALAIHTRSALLPVEKGHGPSASDADMFAVERVAANLVPATEVSMVPFAHHCRYALRLSLDLLELVHERLWLPLLKVELQRKNRGGSPTRSSNTINGDNAPSSLPQISKGIFRHCLRTLHLILFSKDRPTHELDREFAFFATLDTSLSLSASTGRLVWLRDLMPLVKAEANSSDFLWTLHCTLERLTEAEKDTAAPKLSGEGGVQFLPFVEFVLSVADWFCVTASVNEYQRFVSLWAEQASDARPTVSTKPWKATESPQTTLISSGGKSENPTTTSIPSPRTIFDLGNVGIPISLSKGGPPARKSSMRGTGNAGRRSRTPGKDSNSSKSPHSSVLQSPWDANINRIVEKGSTLPHQSREFVRFQQPLATPMFLGDPRKKSHSKSPPLGAGGSFRIPVIAPAVPTESRKLSIREAIFGRKSFLETPPTSSTHQDVKDRGSFRLNSEVATPIPSHSPAGGRSPLLTALGSGTLPSASPKQVHSAGGDGLSVRFTAATASFSAGVARGPPPPGPGGAGSPKLVASTTQDGFLAPSSTLSLLPAPQSGQKLLTESFSVLPINESFSSPNALVDEIDTEAISTSKPLVTDAETYGGLLGSAEEVLQQALRFAHVEGTFVAPTPPSSRRRSPRGVGSTGADDAKECFRRASQMVRRRSSVAAARALSKLEAVSAFSELRARNSFSKSNSSSVFAMSMNEAVRSISGRKASGFGMSAGRPRVTLTYDSTDPCADPTQRLKAEQESCVTVECCLSASAFESPVPKAPSTVVEHRWGSSAAPIRPHHRPTNH